jgi:peptidoglycan/xylan/chitin deacetylase (PgdA/CDA1 family)
MRNWLHPMMVLCYHDLVSRRSTNSWLKLCAEHFDRQIVALKRFANFIRPDAMLKPAELATGRINVLLTFDDGKANHYRLTLPALRRHNVPALFFVSTWHVETGEPFWFDRLLRQIQGRRLSDLDLRPLGLDHYRFSLESGKKRWRDVQRLLEETKRAGGGQDNGLVERILAEIGGDDSSKKSFYEDDEDDRPLKPEEILAMRNSGLCWFGSHAHHHRILTSLDKGLVRDELRDSRIFLENLLDQPAEHIAYPNGDTDVRVIEECQRMGYRFGYTGTAGWVSQPSDPFLIPRIQVGGFDTLWHLFLKMGFCLVTPPAQCACALAALLENVMEWT